MPPAFASAKTGSGAPARWEVIADDTAEGGRALAQRSTDPTDHRFPLAILVAPPLADLEVRVRFRSLAGHVDRAGGLAIRLADPQTYYVARANALENNIRFYHVIGGTRTQLASADVKVPSGQWHELGVRAKGNRFEVSFNGRTVLTVADRTISKAGAIALWTKADSVTHFDRLTVRPIP